MSAQLLLTYNSSVWDYKYEYGSDFPGDPEHLKRHAYPERYSNAGLGWILSMGALMPALSDLAGGDPPGRWLYRAPDGSTHDFGFSYDPVVATTADGSFLRLKRFPADTTVAVDQITPVGIPVADPATQCQSHRRALDVERFVVLKDAQRFA